MSSKYVVPNGRARTGSSVSTITVSSPNVNISDADFVEVTPLLNFRPRLSILKRNSQFENLATGDIQRANGAARHMTNEFNLSMRLRTKPSVIVSHLILGLGYTAYLFFDLFMSTGNGAIQKDLKTTAAVVRILSIVLSLCIAGIATLDNWAHTRPATHVPYLLLILFKALCIASIQLMQVVPDYGQLMFDQAFVWTFLPLHPQYAGVISSVVWAVYGGAKWTGFSSVMPGLNPMVIIAVGLIQSYAHYRRYYGMMTGFLEAKRVDIQRQLMSNESSKCDDLLRSMLPPSIIVKLEQGESITPERFESVTVMFAEICHFSDISRRASAHELVNLLNDVFTTFDELIDKWSVYKVETVCQVYMAVAGCPKSCEGHAAQAANLALEMMACICYMAGATEVGGGGGDVENETRMRKRRERMTQFMGDERLHIHVGINSGPVRAGVVGINNPRFKLFGDTVNTASRMESTCEAGRIQVSPSAFQLLKDDKMCVFELERRGEIEVKGKGKMTTHYVCASSPIQTTTVLTSAKSSNAVERSSGEVGGEGKVEKNSGGGGGGGIARSKSGLRALRRNETNQEMEKKTKQMRALSLVVREGSLGDVVDLEGQMQQDMQQQREKRETKCSRAYLNMRRHALLIIESDINIDTLKALDEDVVLYRSLMFRGRVKWLQLKILILLMGLSFGMSLFDYTTCRAPKICSEERQIMTLLRNAVAIPVFIVLLMTCRNEAWFTKNGEIFSVLATFIATAVMMLTIFAVYSGDPGIAAAMCILVLDVELLRLSWRSMLMFMLLVFYTIMILISRGSGVMATLATPYMVCALFLLAIHAQEHFSHLADCEKRDLEMQTKQLEQVSFFLLSSFFFLLSSFFFLLSSFFFFLLCLSLCLTVFSFVSLYHLYFLLSTTSFPASPRRSPSTRCVL